jgi:hypothetical protein
MHREFALGMEAISCYCGRKIMKLLSYAPSQWQIKPRARPKGECHKKTQTEILFGFQNFINLTYCFVGIFSSISTSKIILALGGMAPGAPLSP